MFCRRKVVHVRWPACSVSVSLMADVDEDDQAQGDLAGAGYRLLENVRLLRVGIPGSVQSEHGSKTGAPGQRSQHNRKPWPRDNFLPGLSNVEVRSDHLAIVHPCGP